MVIEIRMESGTECQAPPLSRITFDENLRTETLLVRSIRASQDGQRTADEERTNTTLQQRRWCKPN
jgi:hypothetical protein